MMKKLIALAMLSILLPVQANDKIQSEADTAEEIVEAAKKELEMEYCKTLANSAETIMDARQRGVSIVTAIDVASSSIDDEQELEIYTNMIKVAYKKPKYSSQKLQQESTTEFGNLIFLACHK